MSIEFRHADAPLQQILLRSDYSGTGRNYLAIRPAPSSRTLREGDLLFTMVGSFDGSLPGSQMDRPAHVRVRASQLDALIAGLEELREQRIPEHTPDLVV